MESNSTSGKYNPNLRTDLRKCEKSQRTPSSSTNSDRKTHDEGLSMAYAVTRVSSSYEPAHGNDP
jgi:hypothetical protein